MLNRLRERVNALFGARFAARTTEGTTELLHQQTEAAYATRTWHEQQATAKNRTALAVQPGLLDARGQILHQALYLEGTLAGARARGLDPELIAALERAVDHSHELTVLLGEAALTTAELRPTAA